MGKRKSPFDAPSKAIDPTLDALFSSSSGPVKAPPKSRYSGLLKKKLQPPVEKSSHQNDAEIEDDNDDEELSEASEELDYEVEEDDGEAGENEESSEDGSEISDDGGDSTEEAEPGADDVEMVEAAQPTRERKRKRKDENDDLEGKYLSKLEADDPVPRSEKRAKANNDTAANEESDGDNYVPPQHESLSKETTEASELDKATRTLFLSNVSSEAISSKSAKKTLVQHLSSVLDADASPPEKVESIRFRSVAFSTGSMPKRAAYITKQLMDSTTKSTHAYAVFSTAAAARKAASQLNSTEVLGRHVRVDSITHPSPVDHLRCVFVGNLGFVDDETVVSTNSDGETVEKKRTKTPADIEEGLWRTFGTQGKVESVRVIRDPQTRVGKGFAYVQFYDANSVESAVLLDGKKFPPMLPRKLRVQRATHPRKTALAQERVREKFTSSSGNAKSTKYTPKLTPEQKSLAGRAGKLLGRSAAASRTRGGFANGGRPSKALPGQAGGILGPEHFVFEGKRASAKDGRPKDLKFGKKSKKKSGKPTNRGTRRAAEWRKKTPA